MVEWFLVGNTVHISSTRGYLFVAAITINGTEMIVHSDRGIDHLLLLLASEIFADNTIKERADETYPYPLSMTQNAQWEKLLRGAYVTISKEGDLCVVSMFQTKLASPRDMPGIYLRVARAPTLLEALEQLQGTVPKRQ